MKKLVILAISLLILGTAKAQEGSWYIGGLAGYSSSDNAGYKSTEWNFSPEIGTWLSNKTQLGMTLGLGGTSDDGGDKTSFFGPQVYCRLWKSLGEKVAVYGGLNVGYSFQTFTNGAIDEERKITGFGTTIDFGLSYALSDRWAVFGRYATIGYASLKSDDPNVKITQFGFDVNTLGNPFNLGIYYTFKQ